MPIPVSVIREFGSQKNPACLKSPHNKCWNAETLCFTSFAALQAFGISSIILKVSSIPLHKLSTALSFPQLLGWKIDNPSGNFAALVANTQSFIAQEPPRNRHRGHCQTGKCQWDFEGKFETMFSTLYWSKFVTEIRCSIPEDLRFIHSIDIWYVLNYWSVSLYIGLSARNAHHITSHWCFLRVLSRNVAASWSFGTGAPTAWTQLFWDVFQISHRLGILIKWHKMITSINQ